MSEAKTRGKGGPEAVAIRTATAKLPSGRTVKIRELTGRDELNAMTEVESYAKNDGPRNMVANWAMLLRATVELDGQPFDQSLYTPESFRNLFGTRDWICLIQLGDTLNGVSEEELNSFRSSIRVSVSD